MNGPVAQSPAAALISDAVTIPFGKHKGSTVAELFLKDLGYVHWLMDQAWVAQRYPELYAELHRVQRARSDEMDRQAQLAYGNVGRALDRAAAERKATRQAVVSGMPLVDRALYRFSVGACIVVGVICFFSMPILWFVPILLLGWPAQRLRAHLLEKHGWTGPAPLLWDD